MTPICAVCGRPNPRVLLAIGDRRTGAVRFVCRPGLDTRDHGRCFLVNVGNRDRDIILGLLVPEAPIVHARSARPPSVMAEDIGEGSAVWHQPGFVVSAASDRTTLFDEERTRHGHVDEREAAA